MSTRSIIARPTAKGWLGVYHHSDGYPSGVGRILWNLYHNRYGGDLKKFHWEVIDNNLDGWSCLHGFHPDWATHPDLLKGWDGTSVTGVDEHMESYDKEVGLQYPLPISYKDDDSRGSPELKRPPFNPRNVEGSWCEWLYIIRPEGLELRNYNDWGKTWALLQWGIAPLWNALNVKE